MKRIFSCLLAAAMVLGLAACGQSASSEAAGGIYTPGTYSATATGMGELTVTVTVDADKITEVTLDLANETPSIGQAAGDTIRQAILDSQGTEFDAVSGATVTTDAVKAALADCLSQARGDNAPA